MLNIEQLVVDPLLDNCEEQGRGQPEPLITQVRECKEGGFKAEFKLALSGIANSPKERKYDERRNRAALIDESIGMLFSNLSGDQVLEFIYGWRHDPVRIPQFDFEVTGASMGETGKCARESAKDLFRSLQVTMGNPAYGFRFAPTEA